MKEENKVLRKVVEQTMKDYYDLQMKFTAVHHQNNQNKVLRLNPISIIFISFVVIYVFILDHELISPNSICCGFRVFNSNIYLICL